MTVSNAPHIGLQEMQADSLMQTVMRSVKHLTLKDWLWRLSGCSEVRPSLCLIWSDLAVAKELPSLNMDGVCRVCKDRQGGKRPSGGDQTNKWRAEQAQGAKAARSSKVRNCFSLLVWHNFSLPLQKGMSTIAAGVNVVFKLFLVILCCIPRGEQGPLLLYFPE